ncbi:MAG: glycosyltransferase [Candidatus Omnitrophota bacterium]|nr:MAG: glycosyltransferase [Candidatus Omnitrophota bacterium]
MRIALIFPPYTHKIFSENLAVVDEEFCVAPPIILAYVAAILEAHGHKVMLLDAKVLSLSKEEALERIRAFKPDILGFRAETYHFHDALDWVRYLKHRLNVPVVAGGLNLSMYPKETLSHSEIDYGIVGEAIESLPRLVSALEYGDSVSEIPGVIHRNKEKGDVIINSPAEKYVDFDSYPFPARHLLPNEKYYSFISQRKNFTVMVTATGCPFKCNFCAIPHLYRPRSVKNVIDEIEACYRDFNVREIDFFDPVLFINKNRALELFHEIKKRKLDIEWSCRSRVDAVDNEILREAAGAGCRQIYYGIESVDPQILHTIKKEIGPAQVKQAIKWSKRYGIRAMGFFMVGNQGETKESVRRTIGFAKDLGLEFIQVCRTIAKPGTNLDKIMIEKSGKDYWREHVSGKKIEGRLPTSWSTLSEPEIEALTKEFYLKFYFRPKIIWSRVLQLKSISELTRYIKVAWRMLLQKSELYSRVLTDTSEAEGFLAQSDSYLSQAKECRVAVVIPTYNEKDNIEGIITTILDILPNAYIVVVDDKSPDGTGDIVRNIADRDKRIHFISRSGEKGLGLAYITGFKYVLESLPVDYIFEMDADFSHNPRYLPIFLEYAKECDLIIGSRFLRRVSIKNRARWRNIISITSKWFINALIGTRLTDMTTGFKCFQKKVLAAIELDKMHSKGYAFQIEMSFLAKSRGFSIKELPILFIERSKGYSKLSLKIIFEGFFLIWRLAIKRLLGFEVKDGQNIYRK